jgi:hypothetical protein
MHHLLDHFLSPKKPPDTPYTGEPDVISIREADDVFVVAEIFKRSNGTFGFRFQAWVAWDDAGGTIRSHSWHEILPRDSCIVDRIDDAQSYAESYAALVGLTLTSGWSNIA